MLHVSSSLGSDRWASWHEVPGSQTRRILPGCSKLLLVSRLHSIVRSESCRSGSAFQFGRGPAGCISCATCGMATASSKPTGRPFRGVEAMDYSYALTDLTV